MTGDYHGRTARRVTLLVTATMTFSARTTRFKRQRISRRCQRSDVPTRPAGLSRSGVEAGRQGGEYRAVGPTQSSFGSCSSTTALRLRGAAPATQHPSASKDEPAALHPSGQANEYQVAARWTGRPPTSAHVTPPAAYGQARGSHRYPTSGTCVLYIHPNSTRMVPRSHANFSE